MNPWFFRQPDRLREERAAIEELRRSAEWLVGAEWLLDAGELCLDAVIRAHGHDHEVRLSYPCLFPEAPVVVRPRNAERRWSLHQYGGRNGPLCLEWGPDNWRSDLTGAQMLESTQRLLQIENPMGQTRLEPRVAAPSRHRLTAGQELRGAMGRWYSSDYLRRFLAEQGSSAVGSFRFSMRDVGDNCIVLVHETAVLGGEASRDEQIPAPLPGAIGSDFWNGAWFKTDLEPSLIKESANVEALRFVLVRSGHAPKIPIAGLDDAFYGVLIVDRSGEPHLFVVLPSGNTLSFSPFHAETAQLASRLPSHCDLAGKSIGIVGLGSAGSKIAVSLARMGARQFYLVDHDLLLPENLVRHALNWLGVGLHKVDATESALRQIAADVQVKVSRTCLVGQESNAAISSVVERLGDYDLIIDATANARVFNLLSAVAGAANKPIVWVEIFGGGIGGLIARSRPGLDPDPQTMRAIYLQYCNEHPASPRKVVREYTVEEVDGEVITASDADVAIIVHHAARLVSDTLHDASSSQYPYSMYLIGLAKDWVFEAPFATIPIATDGFIRPGPTEVDSTALGEDNVEFLVQLLAKCNNGDPPPS